MSNFDPNTFLDATFDQPNTKRSPLPTVEYFGTVRELKTREWTAKADPNKTGYVVDVVITLDIPVAIRESIKLDASTVTVVDSVMLDKDPANNFKNRKMLAYREAIDKNKVGDTFKWSDLVGRMLTVKLKHETYNDNILEKVASVGKAQ